MRKTIFGLCLCVVLLCTACGGGGGGGGGSSSASSWSGGSNSVQFSASALSSISFMSGVGGAGGAAAAGGMGTPLTWTAFELHLFVNGKETVYNLTPDSPNVTIDNIQTGATVHAYADITFSDGSERTAESDTITVTSGKNKLTLYIPYNFTIEDASNPTNFSQSGSYTAKTGIGLPTYYLNATGYYNIIDSYEDTNGGGFFPAGSPPPIKGDVVLKAHFFLQADANADGTLTLNSCAGGARDAVTIPASVDGKPITAIGVNAFRNRTAITSISIPSSVKSIGDYSFYDCTGLESVTIPSNVESLGTGAFYGCTGLEAVTIPTSVESIGDEAFANCSGLESVTIPNGVTSIGDEAFANCSGLESITIPNKVQTIDSGAFKGCTSLESLIIPASVTNIAGNAFMDCTGLTELTFCSTTPPTITAAGTPADLSGVTIRIPLFGSNASAWATALSDMNVDTAKIAFYTAL